MRCGRTGSLDGTPGGVPRGRAGVAPRPRRNDRQPGTTCEEKHWPDWAQGGFFARDRRAVPTLACHGISADPLFRLTRGGLCDLLSVSQDKAARLNVPLGFWVFPGDYRSGRFLFSPLSTPEGEFVMIPERPIRWLGHSPPAIPGHTDGVLFLRPPDPGSWPACAGASDCSACSRRSGSAGACCRSCAGSP